MATQILKTKLFAPLLRQEVVARPQLMMQLDNVAQRPFALISAPAGFGKTMLVAKWMKERAEGKRQKAESHSFDFRQIPFRTAWLSLEEGDNDPVRFLRYVVAALQTAVPDLPEVLTSLLSNQTVVAIDSFLIDLLNAITAVPETVVLVLDDYHLIRDQDIHEGVAFLLDHMPSNFHLIVTTREDPPLPLARLRGRRQLIEIRQADLAFTKAEVAQFLNKVMGLSLNQQAIAALADRTEGWITGLQMAALSMQGQEDVTGFIAAFTGSHRYVLDYLMEEVWQQQSGEIQRFLLQTAVLDELCADLCDKLMIAEPVLNLPMDSIFKILPSHPQPLDESQFILEQLDRSNLFIIPLDEARQWYRYHHLFADLLRQRLQQTAPNLVPVLHGLAGTWYEENCRYPDAIDHFLQGEQVDQAATLILQVAEAYLMRSEVDTLLAWIGALPHDAMGKQPLLFVYQAGAFLLAGRSFKAIELHLQEAMDHSEGEATAEVNVMRGLIAAFRGEAEESASLSQLALQLLPEENIFLRSLVVQNLALAQSLNNDIESVINGLKAAAEVCAEAGNVMSQVICLAHVGEFSVLAGRLFVAQDYYEQAIDLAVDGQGRPLPIMGIAKIGLGEVYREWNHLEKATTLSEEGLTLIQRWGEIGGLDGYISASRIKQAQGDEAGAVTDMAEAVEIAARFDASQIDDYMVGVFRARLDIEQGQMETAVRWLEETGIQNDALPETPYHMWEMGRMTLIRLSIAQQNYLEALALTTEVLPQAKRMGRQGSVIDVLILQAIAHLGNDQHETAQASLQKALALAEPERYKRLFIDKGDPIHQLLLALQQTAIPTNLQIYITILLHTFKSPIANPQSSLLDPLSERELEVLRLIAVGHTNQEIADKLFVALSTVKTHINNIYSKLGVARRTEAVAHARDLHLID